MLLKNAWQQEILLVFYQECHSLIGYVTHYLSCCVCVKGFERPVELYKDSYSRSFAPDFCA